MKNIKNWTSFNEGKAMIASKSKDNGVKKEYLDKDSIKEIFGFKKKSIYKVGDRVKVNGAAGFKVDKILKPLSNGVEQYEVVSLGAGKRGTAAATEMEKEA